MQEGRRLGAAGGARCVRWAVVLGLVGVLMVGASPIWAAGAPEGRRNMGRRGDMRGRRGMGRMGGGRMPGAGMRQGPVMPADCPDFDSALAAWNAFYKRSLYATQREDPEAAKRPLGMSHEAWYQVISRYYEEPPAEYAKDPRWHGDLAAITGHLHLAERNGVRHFGDELTRFHEAMEPVVLWGTGQTHGGVTDENIEEFYAKVVVLDEAWQRVTGFGFYPKEQLGPGGQRQYSVFMGGAADAVEQFRYTVEDRLLDEIPEAAAAVKNAFVPLYMQFG